MEAIPLTSIIQIQDDQGTQIRFNVRVSTSNSQVPHAIQINNVSLSQPRFPSPHLLENPKHVKEICVPLQKATMRGDLEALKSIIAQHPNILTSSITLGGHTVLHLAMGNGNVHFVEHLLVHLSAEDLELRDENNNTAFCLAVIAAPIEIAKLMIERNQSLPTMRCGAGMTPLYMAALYKRSEMTWYLYEKTEESLDTNERIGVFFTCIDTGIYDLALRMLKDDSSLATARDDKNKTALHHLAETPSAFGGQSSQGWTKIFKFVPGMKIKLRRNSTQTSAIDLVRCLWDKILDLGHTDAMELIKTPSELLFDATRIGNFEFLQVLVNSYPDLVWECDSENRTIIHIAVQHRHTDIFNMIHVIGLKKPIILTYEDNNGNNILHLAAMLPPPNRLNIVSGAALQLQKELLWFQEVRKLVIPLYVNKDNNNNMVPKQLFSEEHRELRKDGEKYLKETSHSGLIVSTILTTVVFMSMFSLPGGNNLLGSPNDRKLTSFMIFVLTDGFAMVSSVIAAVMFLSILTSRCAEYDFLVSLPLKLMIALTSLFVSILLTMVAFSSAVAIACQGDLKWVLYLISMFAFVPITLFGLQFPLWLDTFKSTFWSKTMFKPPRQILS